MNRTTRLKELIRAREILVMPGVYDALSAKIAERCGVKAVQVTGYGLAGSNLGLPDVGIMTKTQMVELTRNICRAVSIPVMADGDTGFGNAINLYYAVRDFEAAGAAGINLEDQFFPKRCGHMGGKQIIPFEEAVKKIEAAAAARTDPDFVINARTDAIAVVGVEEAIRRGNAFAKAGADLVFVEAPTNPDDVKRVIESIEAPVSINMIYARGAKTPAISIRQLEEWGAARVSVPVMPLFAAARALERAYTAVVRDDVESMDGEIFAFREFTDLVGLPEIQELERRFLDTAELDARYHR
ncbi:isocitrate lyase/PEP mutase family protein [Oscillibacter sp. MSJ-2]|uniref:Isocitrate lyase/PEP mutase family protein n=1 Tax=Dysosmobacter acutus TaxID=2841504 RepID=A0ABS6FCU4_9FIRM|nr:isocitrate lyase/PEP mutase family protein [Dysosmobacter acutus]MBU5628114.1 isocitrate lyase/PEP mutase family protein [Dysosmobacter acutus]